MHDLAQLVAGIECSKIKLNYVIKHLHLLNLSNSRIEIDRANFHSTELGTLSRNIERIVILEHHIIDDIRLMSVVSHCMPYSTCGMLSIEWIARIPSLNSHYEVLQCVTQILD
ncbi:hypothetical protein AB3S75_046594 [Citrus x aurantiifolia]